jgi:SAM-dependent methyltransferase
MTALENYKKMFPSDHEYFKEWLKTEHIEQKEEYFKILDTYCQPSPTSILDIGCGLAFESRAFNRKYGTELYLLDGDFNSNKETNLRRKDFGPKKNMMYYSGLESLKNFYDSQNVSNYTIINADDIVIADDKKFDLICSWLSCGFHYPVDDYRALMIKHSHKDTKIIVDIRKYTLNTALKTIDIIKVIAEKPSSLKAEIKFKQVDASTV